MLIIYEIVINFIITSECLKVVCSFKDTNKCVKVTVDFHYPLQFNTSQESNMVVFNGLKHVR